MLPPGDPDIVPELFADIFVPETAPSVNVGEYAVMPRNLKKLIGPDAGRLACFPLRARSPTPRVGNADLMSPSLTAPVEGTVGVVDIRLYLSPLAFC